ncbi:MAG: type II secretion system protein GspC [Halioglobus sp.]
MPSNWLDKSSAVTESLADAGRRFRHLVATPEALLWIRRALLLLAAIWAASALATLIWALFPSGKPTEQPLPTVINPIQRGGATATASRTVNIDSLVSWHLFGEPGAPALVEMLPAQAVANERDGIERGARETGLNLTLRGVVASTEDGLGHAIIEYQKRQQVYSVDDELPVPGKVVLAKVMPQQVVIDNAGTYELLTLFEDSVLSSQVLTPAPVQRGNESSMSTQNLDRRDDESVTAIAQSYRQQLYSNPRSLAEVVRVTAVRDNGELRGYRVAPGNDAAQFKQLGFEAGDLVTGINGIALNDPANTMQLYQAMRTASEAVFDILRDSQSLSLSVSLDAGAVDR